VTEAWLVPHCEDENCGLGRLVYTCPACARQGDDYGEPWTDQDKVYAGKAVPFACEHCGRRLELFIRDCTLYVRTLMIAKVFDATGNYVGDFDLPDQETKPPVVALRQQHGTCRPGTS
jgi:hypothetical protein